VGRVILVIAVVLAACSSQRVAEVPLPDRDPTRLSHEQHAQVGCIECHSQTAPRPGSDDHKPCDKCHAQAFLTAPGELCKVCHSEVTPPRASEPLAAPLKKYPSDDIWQAEPSKFSHRAHLDVKKLEEQVGFHVACADCHVRDDKLARPDHAICARCHAAEASPKGLVTMTACSACHTATQQLRVRARLIRGDLKFDHTNHRVDRRGEAIKCEQCHAASTQAGDYATHAAPRIESCVGCHDDSDRTPESARMRVCSSCHAGRVQTVATLAPRNHLPATERPLDHTIAFRRDHAEAAERDGGRCATCHTQMSGNARDTCDDCHQTMRPADHRITFRELDHGPEAAADRSRCARCHVVEFCTACHSQRPRSHGFPGTFASSEHAVLARQNVRACLTCHVAGISIGCSGPGCHQTAVGAPKR
jgi:hypothetical protein